MSQRAQSDRAFISGGKNVVFGPNSEEFYLKEGYEIREKRGPGQRSFYYAKDGKEVPASQAREAVRPEAGAPQAKRGESSGGSYNVVRQPSGRVIVTTPKGEKVTTEPQRMRDTVQRPKDETTGFYLSKKQEQQAAKGILERDQGYTQGEAVQESARFIAQKQGRVVEVSKDNPDVFVAGPAGTKANLQRAADLKREQEKPTTFTITVTSGSDLAYTSKEEVPNLFGAESISEAPKRALIPRTEAKISDFINAEQGTTAGILAGSAYSVYSYGKGYVEGSIAFFDPRTYVNLVKAVLNPSQTFESFQNLGPEILRNPALLAEIGGQYAGFGDTSKTVSRIVKSYQDPTVIGKEATSVNAVEVDGGAVVYAKSNTIVKVGLKNYKVVSAGKEFIQSSATGAELQNVISRVESQTNGFTFSERMVGKRLRTGSGSVGYESGQSVLRAGNKKPLLSTSSIRYTTKEIANVNGLKVEIGSSFIKSSDFIKITQEALRSGNYKQAAESGRAVVASIGKEIYADTKSRGAEVITRQISGERAIKAVESRILKDVESPPKSANVAQNENTGKLSSAKASDPTILQDVSKTTISNKIDQSAKLTAKFAYVEQTQKLPGAVIRTTSAQSKIFKNDQNVQQVKKTTYSVKTGKEQRSTTIINQRTATFPKTAQKAEIISKQAVGSRSITSTVETPQIAQIQDQTQETEQKVKQEIISKFVQISEPKSQLIETPRITPRNIPPPIVPKIDSGPGQEDTGLFETFVRRRGRFEIVGRFTDPQEAIRAGARVVQGTAAASFKVTGDGSILEYAAAGLNPSQFRESKREPGVVVERVSQRINTPGELGEITFKGISISRSTGKKKKRRGFNVFGGF